MPTKQKTGGAQSAGLDHVLYVRTSDDQEAMLAQMLNERRARTPGAVISKADIVRALIERAGRELRPVAKVSARRRAG